VHDTAFKIGSRFLAFNALSPGQLIVEIGSCDVNGTLRAACPPFVTYIGLDMAHGPGVDFVIKPDEPLPVRAEFADLVLSSSQMEHDPLFWKTFLELLRILKPGGKLYMNAPANGSYHAFPLDVWRFYPDAGLSLTAWARANGYIVTLVESFIAERESDIWNDFVAVFYKGELHPTEHIDLLSDVIASTNIRTYRNTEILRWRESSEDQMLIFQLKQEVASLRDELERKSVELADLQVRSAPNIGEDHIVAPSEDQVSKIEN